ncbi:hypothetical protein BDW75DRAFT_246657 [Aspergillus navahoensis]
MPATTVQSYLDSINSYSQSNARYKWLLSYLRRDPMFLRERMHPSDTTPLDLGMGRPIWVGP